MLDHPNCSNVDIREKIVELNDDENGLLDMDAIFHIDSSGIQSTGYVVYTLEAALWSFIHNDNYKDTILSAVNLGSDTDTIAALTGALAGLYYGYDSIPKEWLNTLVQRDYIENLCEKVNFMR